MKKYYIVGLTFTLAILLSAGQLLAVGTEGVFIPLDPDVRSGTLALSYSDHTCFGQVTLVLERATAGQFRGVRVSEWGGGNRVIVNLPLNTALLVNLTEQLAGTYRISFENSTCASPQKSLYFFLGGEVSPQDIGPVFENILGLFTGPGQFSTPDSVGAPKQVVVIMRGLGLSTQHQNFLYQRREQGWVVSPSLVSERGRYETLGSVVTLAAPPELFRWNCPLYILVVDKDGRSYGQVLVTPFARPF